MMTAHTVQLIDEPTADQRANFLTKSLRGDVFLHRDVYAVMWVVSKQISLVFGGSNLICMF